MAAKDGDLEAAERLVALLRRERGAVAPDTMLEDLSDGDLGDVTSRRARFLDAISRLRMPGRPHVRVRTIRDLSAFSEDRLATKHGFGPVLMSLARDIVTKAGLSLGQMGAVPAPPSPYERGRRDGLAGVAPRESDSGYQAAYVAAKRIYDEGAALREARDGC